MSRPTYRDLVIAYGSACQNEGAWRNDWDRDLAEYRALSATAEHKLLTALRKAGIPLEQVAPQ